ncbi:hypothetical protein [Methylobacterium sp.]|nr:hypothetical protein [Methylobacterium sp.]
MASHSATIHESGRIAFTGMDGVTQATRKRFINQVRRRIARL